MLYLYSSVEYHLKRLINKSSNYNGQFLYALHHIGCYYSRPKNKGSGKQTCLRYLDLLSVITCTFFLPS